MILIIVETVREWIGYWCGICRAVRVRRDNRVRLIRRRLPCARLFAIGTETGAAEGVCAAAHDGRARITGNAEAGSPVRIAANLRLRIGHRQEGQRGTESRNSHD